ncbi:MAG: DUF1887 family protein [Clostridia bacterium]|nr:DUF1887 family protein [Clostridia bacterium]
MKTLIELFDTCQLNNIVAGLAFKPEKIIFVGYKKVMNNRRTSALKNFFAAKGIDAEISFEVVGRYDYEYIVNKLSEIIDSNEDCCFDLTGGKELILTAMGEISATKKVPMLQFDLHSGNLVRIKNCADISDPPKSVMRIEESVALNGGGVIKSRDSFEWNLDESFRHDLEIMWRISTRNVRLWNRQTTVFGNFEELYDDISSLRISVDLEELQKRKEDIFINTDLIDELKAEGLIVEYIQKGNIVTLRYKNEQVKRCLSKAGNILELYAYMLLNEIESEEKGFYDHIAMGVIVDWDGEIDNRAETRNEIDLMLMRDIIPVFISCKNGEVHKEALYELQTMAEHFGGEYAKKILLTSYMTNDADSREYIIKRARDMGIEIIDGVDKLGRRDFKDILYKKVR